MEKRLSDIRPGERAVLLEYTANEEIHCRLREMGLICGATVLVKRYAPMGDPIELVVRGFHISLRKLDAESILVKKIEAHS